MIRSFWLVLSLFCITVVVWRLEPVYELGWFLPAPQNEAEQILVEVLGQDSASQLVFVVITVDPSSDVYSLSKELSARLQGSGLFSRVYNGDVEFAVDSLPSVLWKNRYLLTDLNLDQPAMRAYLQEARGNAVAYGGAEYLRLISADPPLASINILQSLQPSANEDFVWSDQANHRLTLLVETYAEGFDLGGQAQAINFLRSVSEPGVSSVDLFGVGVYGVDLQETIRQEATLRSISATVAVLALLFIAYRRVAAVLVGFIPLLIGSLVALASVAGVFSSVHGITLAFGFTLLGVAIDYPLHYLSHTKRGGESGDVASIWPTMRTGLISSLAAFVALTFGGSVGLMQIGLFSATGLLASYLATRTLMPVLVPPVNSEVKSTSPGGKVVMNHGLWFTTAVVCGIIGFMFPPVWTNDLSAVSPVPTEKLLADHELRTEVGAPDVSKIIAIRGSGLEEVLITAEQASDYLNEAVLEGVLTGFLTPTNLVPSNKEQAARMAYLRDVGDVEQKIDTAGIAIGFRPGAFQAFSDAVEATVDSGEFVTPSSYDNSELGSILAGSLYQQNGLWTAVISLMGVTDIEGLKDGLSEFGEGVLLIDLKVESENMMADYFSRLTNALLIGALAVAFFLTVSFGSFAVSGWLLGTLGSTLLSTFIISSFLLPSLSIFNLISAVLVAGLVLDYALFFSREEPDERSSRNTFHAVSICAGSTATAFIVLSMSTIPVLQSIGVTVAAGVIIGYFLTCAGRGKSANTT